MSAFTTDERIALLLTVLGNEVSETALRSMHPTRAKFVQTLVKDYRANPPSDEETEYVIDDFLKYFHFALDRLKPEIKKSQEAADLENGVESTDGSAAKNQIVYFPKLEPTGDPRLDLNQLDAYQISVALGNDHPKTVALVLSCLEPQLAARVLEDMSEETRNAAIVFLSQESTVPALIVDKVLQSTVDKAVTVECRKQSVDQTQIIADLMRSVPKKLRGELLEQLEASDEEFSNLVKKKLYVFEDIGRLGDRDIQKMLGEIQTDFLIVGLQKAGDEIKNKLLGNLSKRARQSVIEEMQYKTEVPQEEIDEARAELTAVLARLDESGEVSLT